MVSPGGFGYQYVSRDEFSDEFKPYSKSSGSGDGLGGEDSSFRYSFAVVTEDETLG